tara:strand:+ start:56535 stop:56798 length:264 start_codon:yes stop_codon:yes gene_type:complete
MFSKISEILRTARERKARGSSYGRRGGDFRNNSTHWHWKRGRKRLLMPHRFVKATIVYHMPPLKEKSLKALLVLKKQVKTREQRKPN